MSTKLSYNQRIELEEIADNVNESKDKRIAAFETLLDNGCWDAAFLANTYSARHRHRDSGMRSQFVDILCKKIDSLDIFEAAEVILENKFSTSRYPDIALRMNNRLDKALTAAYNAHKAGISHTDTNIQADIFDQYSCFSDFNKTTLYKTLITKPDGIVAIADFIAGFSHWSFKNLCSNLQLRQTVEKIVDCKVLEQGVAKYRCLATEILSERNYPLKFVTGRGFHLPKDFVFAAISEYVRRGTSVNNLVGEEGILNTECKKKGEPLFPNIRPTCAESAVCRLLLNKSKNSFLEESKAILKSTSATDIVKALDIAAKSNNISHTSLVVAFLLVSKNFLPDSKRVACVKKAAIYTYTSIREEQETYSLADFGNAAKIKPMEFTHAEVMKDPALGLALAKMLIEDSVRKIFNNPEAPTTTKYVKLLQELTEKLSFRKSAIVDLLTDFYNDAINRKSQGKLDKIVSAALALFPVFGPKGIEALIDSEYFPLIKRMLLKASPRQKAALYTIPRVRLIEISTLEVPSATDPERIKDLLVKTQKLSGETVPLHTCKRLFNLGSQPKEIVQLFDAARTPDGKSIVVETLKTNVQKLLSGNQGVSPSLRGYYNTSPITKHAVTLHLTSPAALADKAFISKIAKKASDEHPGINTKGEAPVIAWALLDYAPWDKQALYISEMQSDNIMGMKECIVEFGEKKGKEYFANIKKYGLLDWPLNLMNLVIKYANRYKITKVYMSTAERIVRRWHGQAPKYTTKLLYEKLPTMYGFRKIKTTKGVFWVLETRKHKEVLAHTKLRLLRTGKAVTPNAKYRTKNNNDETTIFENTEDANRITIVPNIFVRYIVAGKRRLEEVPYVYINTKQKVFDQLYVPERHRGKGYASMLMHGLAHWMKVNCVKKLTGENDNPEFWIVAQQLYAGIVSTSFDKDNDIILRVR